MIRSSSILICAILGSILVWSDAIYAEDGPTQHTVGRFLFGRNKTYAAEDNSVEQGVVLLDFYNDACGPCRAMMPAVDSLVKRGYRISKVNTDKFPAWTSRFNITKIPCFVVIIDGQEVARHTGPISEQKLENMLVQAGARPVFQPKTLPATSSSKRVQVAESAWRGRETSLSVQEIVAGKFQFNHGLENAPIATQIATNVQPNGNSEPNPSQNLAKNLPQNLQLAAEDKGFTPVSNGETSETPNATVNSEQRWQTVMTTETHEIANASPNTLGGRILSASVRIRVENALAQGSAVGSGTGTIIDCRSQHALILTCGHLFREFKTGDTVLVDVFTENGVQSFPARYLHHDEERDLGLISFIVKNEVTIMPLAPSNLRVYQGMPIITAGCSEGNPPTLQKGVVTGLNRYLRAPNIEVSAVPVQGRSGGGIFTENGELIGVCFAADPQDSEGLCTSMVAIHDYLKDLKMDQFVQAPRNESVAFATPKQVENSQHVMDLPRSENSKPIPFNPVATPMTAQTSTSVGSEVANPMPTSILKPAEREATSLAGTTQTVAPIIPVEELPPASESVPVMTQNTPQTSTQNAQSAQNVPNVPVTPIPGRSLTGEEVGTWPPRWE